VAVAAGAEDAGVEMPAGEGAHMVRGHSQIQSRPDRDKMSLVNRKVAGNQKTPAEQ
jgi:hypothetical protein